MKECLKPIKSLDESGEIEGTTSKVADDEESSPHITHSYEPYLLSLAGFLHFKEAQERYEHN